MPRADSRTGSSSPNLSDAGSGPPPVPGLVCNTADNLSSRAAYPVLVSAPLPTETHSGTAIRVLSDRRNSGMCSPESPDWPLPRSVSPLVFSVDFQIQPGLKLRFDEPNQLR